MAAVWRAVNKKSPPPPELIIGLDWRNFGTPYASGGLRDQPMNLYRRMKEALYYYDAFMVWKSKPEKMRPEQYKEWHKRNRDVVELVNKAVKSNGE